MDLSLSILEQCKKNFDNTTTLSTLPKKLQDVCKNVYVKDINELSLLQTELNELSKFFDIVIAGSFPNFICGLTKNFFDITLFAVVPPETDLGQIRGKISFLKLSDVEELTPEGDYKESEDPLISGEIHINEPSGPMRFSPREYTRLVISYVWRDPTEGEDEAYAERCVPVNLILLKAQSQEELEYILDDPSNYVHFVIWQFILDIEKCIGVPDKTGKKWVFFKTGAESSNIAKANEQRKFPEYHKEFCKYCTEPVEIETLSPMLGLNEIAEIELGSHPLSNLYKNLVNLGASKKGIYKINAYNRVLCRLIDYKKFINEDHTRKGLMSEALMMMCKKAFNKTNTKQKYQKLKEIFSQ